MIKEFPKIKRMVIAGKSVVIKVDLVINEVIYLEKDDKNKVYNFYFPSDAPNNIYFVGCSMPVVVLDAYDFARFEKNISISAKNISNVVIKRTEEIPDINIGE